MPYIENIDQLGYVKYGGVFSAVRGALTGGNNSLENLSLENAVVKATDIGAKVILLAQCVRETNLGTEYLDYSTLPTTNVSNLFSKRGSDWGGSGDTFTGNIRTLYDNAVASYPSVYDMFSFEDRQQFLEHPLIPYRLGTYIHAYMKYTYGS
tara:strand:- start:555 stop:1010 length:456 start_codon:yes stop_codon:yes gene_type:complete